MPEPLVSVIIPTYNRAKLVRNAIKSAASQSYRNLEILVVDDASIDQTTSLISNLIKIDPRIRLISLKHNLGEVAARNIGIQKSRGLYCAFLDSDDLLTRDSIKRRMELLTTAKSKREIIYGNIFQGKEYRRFTPLHGKIYPYLMRELSLCPPGSLLVPRRCFDISGYPDSRLPSWGDDDMVIKLAKHFPFRYVDISAVRARLSLDSVSIDQRKNRVGCQMMVKKYQQDILKYHGFGRLLLWQIRIFRLRVLEFKVKLLQQGGVIPVVLVYLIRIFMYVLDKFLFLFFDNLFV